MRAILAIDGGFFVGQPTPTGKKQGLNPETSLWQRAYLRMGR
ncbi:MAG: hypothetical protein ABS956_00905 [Pseudomonas sp.]